MSGWVSPTISARGANPSRKLFASPPLPETGGKGELSNCPWASSREQHIHRKDATEETLGPNVCGEHVERVQRIERFLQLCDDDEDDIPSFETDSSCQDNADGPPCPR
eukprot:3614674-Amphidinium_carterae.1